MGVLLVLLASVFWLNISIGSSISNPGSLATELGSRGRPPHTWGLEDVLPMKYRPLFRWIVKGSWSVMFWRHDPSTAPASFRWTYVGCSFAFFFATLAALYVYLEALGFSRLWSFTGCLMLLACPPVTYAYVWPVHTREDPLAYFLVLIGLIAVLRSKPVAASGIATVAALCRETTLVLPLAYALAPHRSPRKKLLVCAPPVIAVVLVRVALGFGAHNPFAGSVRNIEYPLETLIALFLVFGVLWLPGLAGLRQAEERRCRPDQGWHTLRVSAPVVLAVVLLTHLVLARAREIRISFLAFPWLIPFALGWLRERADRPKRNGGGPGFWRLLLAAVTLLSLVFVCLFAAEPSSLGALGAFSRGRWLVMCSVHFASLLALAVLARREREGRGSLQIPGGIDQRAQTPAGR
jgi:hypothetical protein